MAWVKVPPENHPKFHAALPKDPRVETMKMFGGVAAKVNGRLFAGLFGRSTMVWLPELERAAALALPGAAPFDPMGNGRMRSDKVMLPERFMDDPAELGRWLARAFEASATLSRQATATKSARTEPKPAAVRSPASVTTIDAYLKQVDGPRRKALEQLRATIHAVVPDAEECISYRIPAFRSGGKIVAGFSATAKGCSYFPFSGSTLATLRRELAGYEGTKSALHFRPEDGLPTPLVRKLIRARIAEGPRRRGKARKATPSRRP